MEERLNDSNIYAVMFTNYPDIVSVGELAEMLRTGNNNARRLVKDGIIKSFKIGNVYKIPKVNIIDYIVRGGS